MTEPGYTEADVQLATAAMHEANLPAAWQAGPQIVPFEHFARAALDALAEAGRRPAPGPVAKTSYVHAPHLFLLSQACIPLVHAFGVPYHVGSSLHRPDFRDVDVRLILPDDQYAAMFPGAERGVRDMAHSRWSVMCSSISLYLSQASAQLRIDFQFQQMTEANRLYKGPRHPLGIFPDPGPDCGCDNGWVEDENWSPEQPGWDGRREPGDGLIRCGLCDWGGHP